MSHPETWFFNHLVFLFVLCFYLFLLKPVKDKFTLLVTDSKGINLSLSISGSIDWFKTFHLGYINCDVVFFQS